MANPVPSALALTAINDGSLITAAPHRNNYAALQAFGNLIRACLAGGAAGQFLKAVDSTDVVWASAGELGFAVILNGTVSYTPPTGTTREDVECIGGGGGGGGCPSITSGQLAAGGGGGGGGYSTISSTANIGTHTVAVGAGGAVTTGAAGSLGGSTTFKDTTAATICAANGGLGGGLALIGTATTGGGSPLAGAVGPMQLSGAVGATGLGYAGGSFPGAGGSAARGGGGGVSINNNVGNGNPAPTPGGGGGAGGCNTTGPQGTQAGGLGAAGLLLVRANG